MSDNLTTTTTVSTVPASTVIATDDVSSVHFQKIKIADGAADSSAMIGGDAANGLDVDVTRVTGTVAVSVAAGAATPAKAEDAASANADVGIPAMAVQKATPANTAGADGDYEFLQISAGRLWASATIDAALPAGSNAIGKLAANSGVDVGDVDVTSVSGNVTVVQGTATNLRVDASGVAVPVTDNSGSLTVDNAGTFAVQSSIAAGATNIAKAEDAASANADVGVPAMAVQKATPANTAGADGDYEFLQMSAGRLWASATIDAALPAGTNAIGKLAANSGVDIGDVDVTSIAAGDNNIGNVDIVTMPNVTNAGTFAVQATLAAGATAIAKAEDAASADADVGVPAMAVRKATPANTSGADGDYEMLQMSAGRLWVDPSGVTLTVASHAVTNAGTFVTQENGSALTSLQLIDDPVIADDAAFTPATTKVMMAGFEADETSTDSVDEGDGGAARMTLDRKVIVTAQPHTAGGLSIGNFTTGDTYTALTNSAQVVKASAGQVYGWYIYNPNAAATYVMVYNIAAASVTVGTSTALLVFCIPATSAANVMGAVGIPFDTAISAAAATTGGGNTAPSTALECMLFYK